MVELPTVPQRFCSETAAQELSDRKRSDTLKKRYETLLRLSKCLTSARPLDLVASIVAELRPIVDFDLLDIVIKAATPGETCRSSVCECQGEGFSTSGSGSCGSPLAEEIKCQCSMPLISRGSELGVLVVGRFDTNDFGEDDIEFLTQVANQAAIVLDNSWAHRHIAHLTEKLTPETVDIDAEIPNESNFEGIVGRSTTLRSLVRQVETVAPTHFTVLIYGETGTGKELIARAIHNLSSRRARSFVRMNCAAIPTGLLESELFGHEKGAFTGANAQRIGRFGLADQGTLFLDEIGDISLELQPKLLRVLQEHEFERLGSAKTIQVNVRMVAATHRDLSAMVRDQKFREDLFYRLNVFPIEIPPLRERRDDIPLLVNYFMSKFSRRMRKQITFISDATLKVLTNNPWRGNVRELANLIERAVILSTGEELKVPMAELLASSQPQSMSASGATFHEAERRVIIDALSAASGRVAGNGGAAERLGLKRTTLQHKMRRLGITKAQYGQ